MTSHIEEFFRARAPRPRPRRVPAPTENVPVPARAGRLGSAWRHTKTGYRPDLQRVLRSGWEANVCRVLTAYDIPFDFEPQVFRFPVKRGNRGYCPDIYLPETQEWLEVKGYFDDASRIKLKRFRKHYPHEAARLTMIIGRSAASIAICEALGYPYFCYGDLEARYRPVIGTWE